MHPGREDEAASGNARPDKSPGRRKWNHSQSDLGHVWRRSERQELSSPQRRSWNFWNFLERTQALKRLHPKATSCTLGGRARLRQTTRGQNLVGEDMTKIHTFGDGGAAGEVRSVSKLLKTSRRSPSHCLTQPRPPAQGTIGSLTAVTSAALVHRLALLISWIHRRAPKTCLHVQRLREGGARTGYQRSTSRKSAWCLHAPLCTGRCRFQQASLNGLRDNGASRTVSGRCRFSSRALRSVDRVSQSTNGGPHGRR